MEASSRWAGELPCKRTAVATASAVAPELLSPVGPPIRNNECTLFFAHSNQAPFAYQCRASSSCLAPSKAPAERGSYFGRRGSAPESLDPERLDGAARERRLRARVGGTPTMSIVTRLHVTMQWRRRRTKIWGMESYACCGMVTRRIGPFSAARTVVEVGLFGLICEERNGVSGSRKL